MLVLAAAGDRASALQLYAGLRERLAGELGVEPSEQVRRAHLSLVGRGPTAPAAANLSDRPRQTIATYLAELSGGDRLGSLAVEGDPDTGRAKA